VPSIPFRRSHFVAHHRDQVGLGPLARDGLVPGLDKFPLRLDALRDVARERDEKLSMF